MKTNQPFCHFAAAFNLLQQQLKSALAPFRDPRPNRQRTSRYALHPDKCRAAEEQYPSGFTALDGSLLFRMGRPPQVPNVYHRLFPRLVHISDGPVRYLRRARFVPGRQRVNRVPKVARMDSTRRSRNEVGQASPHSQRSTDGLRDMVVTDSTVRHTDWRDKEKQGRRANAPLRPFQDPAACRAHSEMELCQMKWVLAIRNPGRAS